MFGAFLVGLLIPEKLRHMAQDRFDVPVSLLLLPFFFLATGLKTKFEFGNPEMWYVFGVAMFVCITGKFFGVTLPTYLVRPIAAVFDHARHADAVQGPDGDRCRDAAL